MTDMVWKDSYDAGAGPYTTPSMVKQYYVSNTRYPSSVLADPELRSWFMKETDHTSPGSSSTPKSTTHKSNTGAIAGGVVGGVLGLALLMGIIWWIVRKNKRGNRSTPEYRKAELENTNQKSHGIFQWARQPPAEIHGSQLHEMEGSTGRKP